MPTAHTNCIDCGIALVVCKRRCRQCYQKDWWERRGTPQDNGKARKRCTESGCERYATIGDLCNPCKNREAHVKDPSISRSKGQVKGKSALRFEITSIQSKVDEVQNLYDRVVGLDNRIRWRRILDELIAQRRLLEGRLNA